jgi:hypothetical protein
MHIDWISTVEWKKTLWTEIIVNYHNKGSPVGRIKIFYLPMHSSVVYVMPYVGITTLRYHLIYTGRTMGCVVSVQYSQVASPLS